MVVLKKVAAGMAFSSALMGATLAHPGEKHDHAMIKRELALLNIVASSNKRALGICTGSPADVALKQRAVARREAKLHALRQKRGIHVDEPLSRRDQSDLESWMETSHESSEDYTADTDPSTIFSQNATCVIVPEVTIGPYWVSGELIRQDVTDGEPGVPIHVDIQFVDVSSCEGVSDLLVDIWHTNSTGVYSGVSSEAGLDTTYCRGIQQTDSDGVVEFDSIYPGHYVGRTNHIHIKTTDGATVLDNGTYVEDGTTRHIGQLFFDQDLTTEVKKVSPYDTNTQALTTVDEDSIAASEATDEYDPFLSYVRLGDSIEDGLLMFITVGIDTTADYEDQVSAAAHYYEDGGVSNGNSGGGGMGGGPGSDGGFGGNGTTFPSGSSGGPNGTAAVSSSTAASASTGTVEMETETETATASTDDENATATGTAASTSTATSGAGRNCRVPGRRHRH
ncbi:putative extracellular dioxygenase [Zalerion maritima]|uniref:Extracellular dioxygenase n=1 Tax=Zalerion maritima TaxID=339359 RepID=A0AAD5WTR6_9PEZI|nr:putative extracellular dioxygenase [Zalerion maritima]